MVNNALLIDGSPAVNLVLWQEPGIARIWIDERGRYRCQPYTDDPDVLARQLRNWLDCVAASAAGFGRHIDQFWEESYDPERLRIAVAVASSLRTLIGSHAAYRRLRQILRKVCKLPENMDPKSIRTAVWADRLEVLVAEIDDWLDGACCVRRIT